MFLCKLLRKIFHNFFQQMVNVSKSKCKRTRLRGCLVVFQHPVDNIFHISRLPQHLLKLLTLRFGKQSIATCQKALEWGINQCQWCTQLMTDIGKKLYLVFMERLLMKCHLPFHALLITPNGPPYC